MGKKSGYHLYHDIGAIKYNAENKRFISYIGCRYLMMVMMACMTMAMIVAVAMIMVGIVIIVVVVAVH